MKTYYLIKTDNHLKGKLIRRNNELVRVYISEEQNKDEVIAKTQAHSFIDAKVRLGLE